MHTCVSELVTNVCIQKECAIAPISRPERLKAAKDEVLIKDHSDHEESTMLMVVLNYKEMDGIFERQRSGWMGGGGWKRGYMERFPQDPDGSTSPAGGIIIPSPSKEESAKTKKKKII